MSEERRPRHGRPRVGDETQARIDDLAGGWQKPSAKGSAPSAGEGRPEARAPEAKPASASRPLPPPPPGAADRTKGRSTPPPPPGSRPAKRSAPPPLPPAIKGSPGAAKPATPASVRTQSPTSGVIGGTGSVSIAPEPSRPSRPSPSPPPVTDWDEDSETMPFETLPELAADASPIPAAPPEYDEDDEDAPTLIPSGEARSRRLSEPLAAPPALPRRRGLWGDMRYVWTVAFGVRRLRRDLEDTEAEIEAEKRSRDEQLGELARHAIAELDISSPPVEEAREQLVALEEARSRKVGAATAVEEAIGAIERERNQVKEERERRVAAIEDQIAELDGEIEPMEKERLSINRRIRKFKDELAALDERIAATEDKLAGAAAEEASELEAELASLAGEREAVAADEPALAEELAAIEPPLRELKAKRGELKKSAAKLRRREDESVVRSAERIAAAEAHKLVVDRAAADMTREQNELLRDLGLTLYDDPPMPVAAFVVPLKNRMDLLAELKARAVRLRDELASVERWPVVRGALLWLLVLALIGAGVYLGLALS